MTDAKWTEGWRLFWLLSLALAAMALALLVAAGGGTEAWRLVIRATARTSLLLFLAAFVASAAARLWPGAATHWLRRNRRQLGLAFAMSHLIHALAIVTLYRTDPGTFWTLTNPATIINGSAGYLFIVLLAATSFDRVVRAIGPKAWGWLHWLGVWFVAISFIVSNGKRLPVSTWYALPVALVIGAIALRLAARRQGVRAD
jgi:DMSO/TMAO reductase YedYZ heme-binding membrane subunit